MVRVKIEWSKNGLKMVRVRRSLYQDAPKMVWPFQGTPADGQKMVRVNNRWLAIVETWSTNGQHVQMDPDICLT